MTRFNDTVALVTGGTSGIGLATAQRLHQEGSTVIITGRDDNRLAAAADQIGDRVTALRADAGQLSDTTALMDTIARRHGRLDAVFVNAGLGHFAPSAQITEEDFDRSVAVNFKGVFFTIQKAVDLLGSGSSIVINSSWTINRGMAAATLYSATKAAVRNLVQTFAADLGPHGIRVNSVSPGYIATAMFDDALGPEGHYIAKAETVAGRIGTGEDIAGAVAFLLSADAGYVNGQDIIIDGGLVAAIPNR